MVLALAGCSGGDTPGRGGAYPGRLGDPWSASGAWHRGQLHTHSTRSDGLLSPQGVVDCYRDGGFGFLAISDHDTITDPSTLDSRGMALIPAVEWTAPGGSAGKGFHLLALGAKSLPKTGTSAPAATAFFRSQGALVFVAHPTWEGTPLTVADINSLTGLTGVEIHSGLLPDRGAAVALWNSLLLGNPRLWCSAVDDNHNGLPSRGKGWVVARVPELAPESLLDAIKAGHFYATSGPALSSVAVTAARVDIECSPSVAVSCATPLGTRTLAGSHLVPFKSASFALTGTEAWVRVEIRDAQGRSAWSNPIVPAPEQPQGGGGGAP